jgi:hypothetical protein
VASRIGRPTRPYFAVLGLSMLLLFVAACGDTAPPVKSTLYEEIRLGEKFREFYPRYGGEAVFGPLISEADSSDGIYWQYTSKVKMIFDLRAPSSRRWSLAPLPEELGYREPALAEPLIPNALFIDGHLVDPFFFRTAEELGWVLVGPPIGEVHYSPESRTYFQFFRNLGLYRSEDDAQNQVFLIDLGLQACQGACRTTSPITNTIVGELHLEPQFQQLYDEIGLGVTGFPVCGLGFGPQGSIEVIFENMVLRADFPDLNPVYVAPMMERLGRRAGEMAVQSFEPGYQFVEVQAGKGYQVPHYFVGYIEEHGGFERFGKPVESVQRQSMKVWRQCFDSMCLDYDQNGFVRPAPMGYTYKSLFCQPVVTAQPAVEEQVSLQVWRHDRIRADQEQEFVITVKVNGAPAANKEPVLYVRLPDGVEKVFTFPPTRFDGQTTLRLPPIVARNNTLIPHRVCLSLPAGGSYCSEDSFLIWNEP